MFCKHNYQYTQGHFYCTKCGHRTYKEHITRKNSNSKVVIAGIVTAIIVGGIIFAFQKTDFSEKTLQFQPDIREQDASQNKDQVQKVKPQKPETQASEYNMSFWPCSLNSNGNGKVDVDCYTNGLHHFHNSDISNLSIDEVRLSWNAKGNYRASESTFSEPKTYDLGKRLSKEPSTTQRPTTLSIPTPPTFPKMPTSPTPTLNAIRIESLIHEMINDQRSIYGLAPLSYDQTISKIARTHSQDMANNDYFAHESLTGLEPWDRGFPYGYDVCGTLDAILLKKQYDELSKQYESYPQTIYDERQYQQAMALYHQLNGIADKLDSHRQNNELFGGLAENIAQNWTYNSISYLNGAPTYHWNSEEDIATLTVNGWMNSQGHRQNILSGFHSEGIGVDIAEDGKVYVTQNFC